MGYYSRVYDTFKRKFIDDVYVLNTNENSVNQKLQSKYFFTIDLGVLKFINIKHHVDICL